MGKLELDKWDVRRLHEYHLKRRLNLKPDYQRDRVWDDARKYGLIDTVLRNWPSGLVMLQGYPRETNGKASVEQYDVVDGQQRLSTLFEYIEGKNDWCTKPAKKAKDQGFMPYGELPESQQTLVDEYKVAVAILREYEYLEIQDVYSRLQSGKPLTIGERIKATGTPFKEGLKLLAEHKLFDFGRHRFRYSNWNLAAQFLKACFSGDAFDRVEFADLQSFLTKTPWDELKANRARERASRVMTFELKVFEYALGARPDFSDAIASARTLKWHFAALMSLFDHYALTGREHLVARGVAEYFDARQKEGSAEWVAYLNSGRTGRMDTGDVQLCVAQLTTYLLNAAGAEPLDNKRWFNKAQREQIFTDSGGMCQSCGVTIVPSNYHADHKKPYAAGGHTTVENGQALCVQCNVTKGMDVLFHIKD